MTWAPSLGKIWICPWMVHSYRMHRTALIVTWFVWVGLCYHEHSSFTWAQNTSRRYAAVAHQQCFGIVLTFPIDLRSWRLWMPDAPLRSTHSLEVGVGVMYWKHVSFTSSENRAHITFAALAGRAMGMSTGVDQLAESASRKNTILFTTPGHAKYFQMKWDGTTVTLVTTIEKEDGKLRISFGMKEVMSYILPVARADWFIISRRH